MRDETPVTDATLDARGLACPLPVLRANKSMRGLAPGGRLTVLATDPAARADFASYCKTTGHDLVEIRDESGDLTIILRKAG